MTPFKACPCVIPLFTFYSFNHPIVKVNGLYIIDYLVN